LYSSVKKLPDSRWRQTCVTRALLGFSAT